MAQRGDPAFQHARREAIIIMATWLVAMTYSCTYCYFFGYIRPDRPLGPENLHFIFGIPSWVLWGILAPWFVCAAFTFWFAGWFMADDDLGSDHAAELESDIREEAGHE